MCVLHTPGGARDGVEFLECPPALNRGCVCRAEQMGKSTPENDDARADDPLSDPKNKAAQGNA